MCPDRLDAILFDTVAELRAAREAEDRRIIDFAERLDGGRIAGTIRYRRVSAPEQFEQPMAPALACDIDRPGRQGRRSSIC
jgi:hypothetical protein